MDLVNDSRIEARQPVQNWSYFNQFYRGHKDHHPSIFSSNNPDLYHIKTKMSDPINTNNFKPYQEINNSNPHQPQRPGSIDSWERPRSPSFITRPAAPNASQHSQHAAPSSPTLTAHSAPEEGLGDQPYPPKAGASGAERVWPSNQESGGHRTEPTLPRGIWTSAGSGSSQWLLAIQVILQYEFTNPDLLEEALESPGSGVNCVGKSHRHFSDGNRGLANVGEMVMKLVLTDQCYLFKVPDGNPPFKGVQTRSL